MLKNKACMSLVFALGLIAGQPSVSKTEAAMLATISHYDMDCLAKNIYFEANAESYLGKVAVAHVTLNRAESGLFPKRICSVVFQKGIDKNDKRKKAQFSWTLDGKSDNIPDKDSYEEAKKAAKHAILNRHKDPTYGSLYYHEKSVRPFWIKAMKRVTIIGRHYFYKIKKTKSVGK